MSSFQAENSQDLDIAKYRYEAVQVSETAGLRDYDVVVLTINPFEYDDNNKQLNIHHKINAEISFQNGSSAFSAPNRKNPECLNLCIVL